MVVPEKIPARHYTKGRPSYAWLVVLHTTEGDTAVGTARKVAEWFAGPQAPQASSHYVVGPEAVIACVDEDDTAWHAPPVNAYAAGIELVGWARYTAAEWARPEVSVMLDRAAALVADVCARHAIRVEYVDEGGLVGQLGGVTTHAAVSRAFRKSDHTDPGRAFDMADFLARVRVVGPG